MFDEKQMRVLLADTMRRLRRTRRAVDSLFPRLAQKSKIWHDADAAHVFADLLLSDFRPATQREKEIAAVAYQAGLTAARFHAKMVRRKGGRAHAEPFKAEAAAMVQEIEHAKRSGLPKQKSFSKIAARQGTDRDTVRRRYYRNRGKPA
jgi:hypothetical protein